MARFWYAYNGVGDPLLATSYNQAFTKPTCESGFIHRVLLILHLQYLLV